MISEHVYFVVHDSKGSTFRNILPNKWDGLLDHFKDYVAFCNKRYPGYSRIEAMWEKSWAVGEDTPEFDYMVLDLAYLEYHP